MNAITAFSGAGLPSVGDLTSALKGMERIAPQTGFVILKMDKTGCWCFGADQTEVEDDSLWAINPFSFVHGHIAWAGDKTPVKGTVLGEVMGPITQPLPAVGEVPEHATNGWQVQLGMSVKCVSGEDKGLEATYGTISVGGKKAVSALGLAIAAQVEKDPSKPVPLVRLKKEHYQHKTYGKIYTPVFEIVEWVAMDKEPEPGEAAADPEADEVSTRRRRRA